MINFIDLFAGCGGLTEGFYKQGYNALAHVEIDHYACETLRTRMKHYGYSEQEVKNAVLEADITSEDIIDRLRDVVGDKSVDVIIGGPPCQSFSSLGVANAKGNYDSIVDEIYRLREAKQNAQVEGAEREGMKQRISEMQQFLAEQTQEVTEYDEQLVRRLIEKITVYDEKVIVEFKSGTSMDIHR